MKREFLETAYGLCPDCGRTIPMKLLREDGQIRAEKFCPVCQKNASAVISGDAADFFRRREVVKPALIANDFAGDSARPCPEGCGFCDRHEQHLCMPIVEITGRCNMSCPICINDSGESDEPDMTAAQFELVLDRLLAAEEQIDVLNISGGEPLLHPGLIGLIDMALARPQIVRVSISTNGLLLLEDPGLVTMLKERDVVVSLQFDGFDDAADGYLRGRPMAAERRRILELLCLRNVNMSLVFTLGKVNESQLAEALKILHRYDNVLSLMIQPLAFAGRAAGLVNEGWSVDAALAALDRYGPPMVSRADFSALPCSHPGCFALAYYLKLSPGRLVPLNRLIDEKTLLQNAANKVVFGLNAAEHGELKDLVYRIWSENTEEADEICDALKRLLKNYQAPDSGCKCFNPRRAFSQMEREIKSVFIHAFMDRNNFELSRARRCCQAYAARDGRLIPCCVRNNVRSK